MGGRGSKGGARGDGRRVYRREPGDWLWANRAFWTVALLALSALLSAFRFVTLPQGGSVTFLSLLPLWLVTYFYGPRHGCVAGAVFGFARLAVIFGVGEWVNFSPGAIVLEYPVACGAVAVGGLLLRGFGPRRGRECGCGRGAGRGSGARDEGEEDDVLRRMLMIERLGGVLKYSDVADKVFRSNLSMIDLHMGRLLAEMTRLMWLDDITKVSDLTEAIKSLNPLKIKDELINKHGFYEYKIKEFLLALANGMRPAKLYRGTDSAIAGLLFVTGDGEVLCYQRAFRQTFADFLLQNTRLERGSTEKDKYGYLERENGTYYFKLNLKVGLLKR